MGFIQLAFVMAGSVAIGLGLESNWNQEYRDFMLDLHNEFRRKEGGCQMNKLEYDMEMENQAKGWAEKCVYEHEMIDGRGENLAWDSGHGEEQKMLRDSYQRWFDEKLIYNYGQENCAASCHYSQLVWDLTEKVGCYSTRCPDLKNAYKDAWWVVCFYTPGGNYVGDLPYKKQCDTPCREGQTEDNGLCAGKAHGASVCKDKNEHCEEWVAHDQCNANPKWMNRNCARSCKICEI